MRCIASGLALGGIATLAGPANAHDYWMEYFDRSDTITVAPGNATDTNKAVHSITRWPRASREDRWLSDGEVARRATVRYQTNRATAPRTLSGKAGESGELPQTVDTPEPSASGRKEE